MKRKPATVERKGVLDHEGLLISDQGVGYFLDDLHPHEKRTCMGIHAKYCKQNRDDQIMDILLAKDVLDHLREKQNEQNELHPTISSNGSIELTDEPSVSSIGTVSTKIISTSSIDSESSNAPTEDNYIVDESLQSEFNALVPIYLSEPRILRLSIYKKFVLQFEHFWNNQSVWDMLNLLLIPVFAKDVLRQNKLALSPLPALSTAIEAKPEDLDKSILSRIPDKRFLGIDNLQTVFETLFAKLPDAVLICEDPIIKDFPGKGTFVYTPFSIFSSMIIPEEAVISDRSYSTNPIFQQTLIKFRSVEFSTNGMSILQFDNNNRIIWRCDNFYFKDVKCSDPNVSAEIVWNYMWSLK